MIECPKCGHDERFLQLYDAYRREVRQYIVSTNCASNCPRSYAAGSKSDWGFLWSRAIRTRSRHYATPLRGKPGLVP